MEIVDNTDLRLAFDFVKYTNRNIFLTGKAGTGKTTFLHELKKTLPKRMVVLAPTGVAAINAGGVTIHSFFLLPFHPFVPAFYIPGVKTVRNAEKDGFKMNRERINIIRSLDLLVIDEISMVRADLLDAVDSNLRRYRNSELPFGGVQLLMIGDLQQLAPVAREEDLEILRKYYSVLFFFGSLALKHTNYVTIELKHIYRQKDQVFIDLLNRIRENRIDNEVLSELNKRYIPDFDTESNGGYITLTTHNHLAQRINDTKLESLPGEACSFRAVVENEFPESSYPNMNELLLKKGAQVMFVKNDISGDKLFFNGKLGRIESFEDATIVVKCPEDEYPIRVGIAEWQNMKYTLDDETKEIQETVIGTFRQYPLKLAWAITIHKSQGLTFDRAVIDARAAFAHGQVYVALSRCRSLDGLVLSSKIDQRSVIDNPSVSGFITETQKNQPGLKQLTESKKEFRQKLLTELFDFNLHTRYLNSCIKVINEHRDSISGNPDQIFDNATASIRKDLVEVSEKFMIQLNQIINREAESEEFLQERVKKACEYFYVKLEEDMKEIIPAFSIETDNKAVRKAFKEAYERLKKESLSKLACLNSMKSGFEINAYLDVRARSVIETPRMRSHEEKISDSATAGTSQPALLKQLRQWRNRKAAEMNLPEYMILPRKTMETIANHMPHSTAALKLIKGMGKKKSSTFGEEIINIVCEYCKEAGLELPDESYAEEKPRKKIKKDTKKESFDLYSKGIPVVEIAVQRNLSVTTIEGHLAHYVETGEIPAAEFLSQERIDLITPYFDGNDDPRLAPVKELLDEKASWSELRFVAAHIQYLRTVSQKDVLS